MDPPSLGLRVARTALLASAGRALRDSRVVSLLEHWRHGPTSKRLFLRIGRELLGPGSGGPTEERAAATLAVGRLLALPAARRGEALRADPRLHTLATWGRLLGEALAVDQPALGEAPPVELALLSLSAATLLSGERYGRGLVYDCRALSAAALAWGRQAAGAGAAAARALEVATACLTFGSGDPYAAAAVELFAAAEARAGGRPREAAARLGRGARLLREVEDPHAEGLLRLAQGRVLRELGQEAAAADTLRRAAALLEPGRHPDLDAALRALLAGLPGAGT
jgi:hypothetical protein